MKYLVLKVDPKMESIEWRENPQTTGFPARYFYPICNDLLLYLHFSSYLIKVLHLNEWIAELLYQMFEWMELVG